MSDRIMASGRLTKSEFARFIRSDLLRRLRVFLAVFGFVAALAVLLGAYVAIEDPERAATTLGNVWQAPLVFLVVLVFVLWTAGRSAGVQFSSSQELSNEMTYEFGDDGFTIESGFSSSRSDWESLHAARESKDAFVLFRSKAAFHLLPKRMLNPGDVAGLRELIRSKLGSRAKLLEP